MVPPGTVTVPCKLQCLRTISALSASTDASMLHIKYCSCPVAICTMALLQSLYSDHRQSQLPIQITTGITPMADMLGNVYITPLVLIWYLALKEASVLGERCGD